MSLIAAFAIRLKPPLKYYPQKWTIDERIRVVFTLFNSIITITLNISDVMSLFTYLEEEEEEKENIINGTLLIAVIQMMCL